MDRSKMLVINADGHVLGRLSTFVAKKSLLGEDVIVINAEKAIISGRKDMVIKKELEKLEIKNKGNYTRGPFHQKRPDKFVRKSIRGMIPWNKDRGREALSRIMVYIGSPEKEIEKNHKINLKKTHIDNLETLKKDIKRYVTVEEVCRAIGGRW